MKETMKPSHFAQSLKAARKEAGMTQAKLAKLAGVSPTAIHAIESGKVDPLLHHAIAIARALHISVDEYAEAEAVANALQNVVARLHETINGRQQRLAELHEVVNGGKCSHADLHETINGGKCSHADLQQEISRKIEERQFTLFDPLLYQDEITKPLTH